MFIASFLWRDLLKDIEDMYFPKNSLISRFLYTLGITILLAFIIIYLKQLFELSNNESLGDANPDPTTFKDDNDDNVDNI
jgi:hypothetical protein